MGRSTGEVVPGSRWGTPVEIERRRRILVSVWAYAYEFLHESIVTDSEFDYECRLVDLSIDTGHPVMDRWFKENFNPSTGLWVRKHPELAKLDYLTKYTIKLIKGAQCGT